ncbi:PREDICTED: hypoxia up-regulated protein 1 [Rhagoletis zephyria]|uniref:hypoxia up-regulated protein 1 n=1 Tax=Rhagoletis zephyria TaxID=28612 RepID=UPI00081181A9|nr:PREDICTED: hypoxia up-regulated protein 1 [Rhagoletis zephyria]XP_017493043.1 PREDICTED: hypoxia up-regulated protein 1 [Rhagoletis zephyria]
MFADKTLNQSTTLRRRGYTTSLTYALSLLTTACLLLFTGSHIPGANAAAVMSVDLGTEWMKVGVVSPGVPMEIALNRESKRKTPVILAFRDGLRTFGEDAVTVGIREPSAAYGYLLDLLGKTIDNPIVDLYRKRFPYYEIIADPDRNTVVFKKSDTEQFSVEELVAQILVKAKEFAQESTSQPITECVLTVPGYFGQAEREALLTAAELANLKVLQLINDFTAVALNYGVFHRAEINETAQYYIFFDMGAYKTSAAVVSYQLMKDKVTKETNPVVQVLGVGYDRTLGGLELQLRLRDYLAAEFNAMKKTKTDVTKSPRALAKLFKEAGRVKNVLSANNDHFAQIENLLEDHDFKVQVTREKLEELGADLWPRVVKPLEQALAASGLSLDTISQVIIFGGGTRVPKVQEILKQAINQELGKSLNADEAATMGAVYKAADLATGFKVKKFIVKDAVVFPIQVTFKRDPGDGNAVRQVKRVLFGHMNSYPQKKVITFNKHTEDFDFHVHYGDLSHLSAEEISYIGSLNISHVELEKVKELIEQNQNEVIESKGIKAYFTLDDSGIFRCVGVEFIYEKQKEDEGTLAKLGNTISKLFSKDETKDDPESEGENGDAEKFDSTKSESETAEKREEKDTKATNKTEETKSADEKVKLAAKNYTIKLVTVKEPVQHKITQLFTRPLAGESYEKAVEKLTSINAVESDRNRLESALNALESHVVEIQQKLGEEEYAKCASPEEKEKILELCSSISDWLYEDHENPTPEMYEQRLKDLKKLTNVFLARHWEHAERPDALKAFDGMIDGATKFLNSARNLTKASNPEKDVFTEIEIETLSKAIREASDWKKSESKAQQQLKRHDEVRLTVKDITDKMSLLDREVKYMVNKIKIWKPKVKPTKKTKKDTKTEDAAGYSEGGSGSGANVDDPTKDEQSEAENIVNEGEEQVIDAPTTEDNKEKATPKPSPTEDHTPRSEL